MAVRNILATTASGNVRRDERENEWSKIITDSCNSIAEFYNLQRNIAAEIKSSVIRKLDKIRNAVKRKQADYLWEQRK